MSLVTRTTMLDASANYELHVAFPEREANPNRKFFGCPLYYSTDDKGCDFFLWYDSKIQEDVRKLASSVSDLTLQLHEVQGEKNELESSLDRVIKHSCV
ncbi:hypothetical protein LINPERHAP1_LOCUS25806 [Linum perenne]